MHQVLLELEEGETDQALPVGRDPEPIQVHARPHLPDQPFLVTGADVFDAARDVSVGRASHLVETGVYSFPAKLRGRVEGDARLSDPGPRLFSLGPQPFDVRLQFQPPIALAPLLGPAPRLQGRDDGRPGVPGVEHQPSGSHRPTLLLAEGDRLIDRDRRRVMGEQDVQADRLGILVVRPHQGQPAGVAPVDADQEAAHVARPLGVDPALPHLFGCLRIGIDAGHDPCREGGVVERRRSEGGGHQSRHPRLEARVRRHLWGRPPAGDTSRPPGDSDPARTVSRLLRTPR